MAGQRSLTACIKVQILVGEPMPEELQKFYASVCCGCCTATLHFKNEASISEAFGKVMYETAATIVDDAGITHHDIDTFYGWSQNKDNQCGKSLGYLVSMIP